MNLNGEQTGANYHEENALFTPIDEFYDVRYLKAQLPEITFGDDVPENTFDDVEVTFDETSVLPWVELSLTGSKKVPEVLSQIANAGSRVRLNSVLMAVVMDTPELEQAYWRINAALKQSPRLQRVSEQVYSELLKLASDAYGSAKYVALHYQTETDWPEHCAHWSDPDRWNCMTNTKELAITLALEGIDTKLPVYLMGGSTFALHLKSDVHSKDSLVDLSLHKVAHRELRASIDYYISSRATRFIGNSVSTFSAHLLLERRATRREAIATDFHYNAGDIPLSQVLFENSITAQKQLKWVFAVNSNTPKYNEMIKTAVASAKKNTNLIPICIFYGEHFEIYHWLKLQGVRIIELSPKWIDKLREVHELAAHGGVGLSKFSTNYLSLDKLVSTFLRFDIPTLGFIDDYILYTDTDVVFLHDVSLESFSGMLPSYFLVGSEVEKKGCFFKNICGQRMAYGNAGIMLYNIPNMRNSYQSFIEWTFSREHISEGLHFGEFGPLDQGAYNAYYNKVLMCQDGALFNWKPYWGFNPDALILHFHGPKLIDYVKYIETGAVLRKEFKEILRRCKRLDCGKYVEISKKFALEFETAQFSSSVTSGHYWLQD